MHRSHMIKLNPTKNQITFFKKSCGVARFSYNWALAMWESNFELGKKSSAYDLIKTLTEIKRVNFPWMLEVGKTCPQYAIHNLESAYKNYFKKLKNKNIEKSKVKYITERKKKGLPINDKKLKNLGKPKFKKKGVSESFVAIENNLSWKNAHHKIWIPKLGFVKTYENLRYEGKILSVTVKRIADEWFAVVNVDINIKENQFNINKNLVVLGVDFGIKDIAICSNGKIYSNPKHYKMQLKKLKKEQRVLSKRFVKNVKEQSKNYEKQKLKVAKIHAKIANLRKNTLHQISSDILKHTDVIVLEDLNVSGMVKNHKLAQAILDVGMYELRRQLEYKANFLGKKIIYVDTFYPSSKTCSCCGNVKKELKLSERIYNCEACFHVQDRDLNAADNLRNYGISELEKTSHKA